MINWGEKINREEIDKQNKKIKENKWIEKRLSNNKGNALKNNSKPESVSYSAKIYCKENSNKRKEDKLNLNKKRTDSNKSVIGDRIKGKVKSKD